MITAARIVAGCSAALGVVNAAVDTVATKGANGLAVLTEPAVFIPFLVAVYGYGKLWQRDQTRERDVARLEREAKHDRDIRERDLAKLETEIKESDLHVRDAMQKVLSNTEIMTGDLKDGFDDLRLLIQRKFPEERV